MEGRPIAIFDLDGTLALIDHRRHYVTGDNKNWAAFNHACHEDSPNKPIIKIANELYGSHEIWIVSGRDSVVRHLTERWLAEHEVPYDHLLMRPQYNYTPDHELKYHWLNSIIPKERVTMVFDDRNSVVEMWRKEGIVCLQVAEGDF